MTVHARCRRATTTGPQRTDADAQHSNRSLALGG